MQPSAGFGDAGVLLGKGVFLVEVDENRDGEFGQVVLHERLDLGGPIEVAVAAAELREGYAGDFVSRVAGDEGLEAGLDVFGLRGLPPLLLGGKVEHPLVRGAVELELADGEFAGIAEVAVNFEHLRVDGLKILGQAFAHDALGVDGVDQHFGGGAEKIADDVVDHDIEKGDGD